MLASSCGVKFLKLMQKTHYHLWQNNTNTNTNNTNCECVVFCSEVIIVRDKRLFGEEFLGRFVCGAKSNSHKSRRSSVWAAATAGALPFGCNSKQLMQLTQLTQLICQNETSALQRNLFHLGAPSGSLWRVDSSKHIRAYSFHMCYVLCYLVCISFLFIMICVPFCVTWAGPLPLDLCYRIISVLARTHSPTYRIPRNS